MHSLYTSRFLQFVIDHDNLTNFSGGYGAQQTFVVLIRLYFLVSYVGERLLWPIQSPNDCGVAE